MNWTIDLDSCGPSCSVQLVVQAQLCCTVYVHLMGLSLCFCFLVGPKQTIAELMLDLNDDAFGIDVVTQCHCKCSYNQLKKKFCID